MHVRFSTCIGTPVTADDSAEILGTVAGILIHPDTAKVEGFFVEVRSFMHRQISFLPSIDILRWGLRVGVRHAEALTQLEDLVRLQPLLDEGRSVLGQRICTESGRTLGRCDDVQFDTQHFLVEWLFPRAWWRWKTPLPVTHVLEVRPDMIVVRDQAVTAPEPEPKVEPTVSLIDAFPETA